MRDILFPNSAYTETEFTFDETSDVEWDRKRNSLYWAGSTTGGYATDDNWQFFQRQRCVELAQNPRKADYYLRVKVGVAKGMVASFDGRLFNVAFTHIFQRERKSCRDHNACFKTKSWANKDETLKLKLAFDVDGNGISGRFYKSFASKPVMLKQTLLREWYDDCLVSWLHYVPVSQSMEELPELASYLTLTETGQRITKQIALNGREWYSRSFRRADLGLYIYRVLLEMTRVQDPERMPHS
ncbi:beta- -xylosyltransferase 1 [Fusarium langsethiae]|uniref:Beta--xylosyltransferase 1 n=1 Tax=Fusarium langsethiae TaxID=179993 RepID=A0A0M9ER09_FUSLA|nr:beta- -xylosyltransferase 1 [Fusarium langsethiae]